MHHFYFTVLSKCNLISFYSFSKQCAMVEGNSAPDERSGKRTVFFFFFFIPNNGYCIRRLEYLLAQAHSNPMMY